MWLPNLLWTSFSFHFPSSPFLFAPFSPSPDAASPSSSVLYGLQCWGFGVLYWKQIVLFSGKKLLIFNKAEMYQLKYKWDHFLGKKNRIHCDKILFLPKHQWERGDVKHTWEHVYGLNEHVLLVFRSCSLITMVRGKQYQWLPSMWPKLMSIIKYRTCVWKN